MAVSKSTTLALSIFGILLALTGLFWAMGSYEKNRRHERAKEFEDRYAAIAEKLKTNGSLEAIETLKALPVAYKDRVQPLDSVAKKELQTFSGKRDLYGQPAVLVYLSLLFDSEAETHDVPIFFVGHGINKEKIGMANADSLASYDQITKSAGFAAEAKRVEEKMGRLDFSNLSAAEQEVLTLRGRCRELAARFPNTMNIAPPYAGQEADEQHALDWHQPIAGDLVNHDKTKAEKLTSAWKKLESSWTDRDGAGVKSAAAAVVAAARDLGPQHFPAEGKIERELRFNRINPMSSCSMFYISASLVMLAAMAFRLRAFRYVAFLLLFCGLAMQGYGFAERVALGFGVAITNLTESMLAVAAGCALFALICDWAMKIHWTTIAGGMGAFFILQAVDIYTVKYDAGIGGTVAVLANNFWVHIHVPTVMASYAAFFVAFILSIVALPWIVATRDEKMTDDLKSLVNSATVAANLGTLLIFAGLILGGVWAHDSWGRFWGWDPKETWAAILFLYYMVLAHGRYTKWMRPFWALWWMYGGGPVMLFTYYGTNELLSGLHSYANSAGGGGFIANLMHDKNRWFVWSMGILMGSWLAIGAVGMALMSKKSDQNPTDDHSAGVMPTPEGGV